MSGAPRDPLLIKDPWPSRAQAFVALIFICSWRGHDRRQAFSGGTKPCVRCGR